MKRLNLKDEIISFETSKLAKEKGFVNGTRSSYCHYLGSYVYDGDPDHRESYKKDDIILDHDFYMVNNSGEIDISCEHYSIYEAPTQSLLQRWLREAHDINVRVACNAKSYYFPMIEILEDGATHVTGPKLKKYEEYEQALEFGLYEALKII